MDSNQIKDIRDTAEKENLTFGDIQRKFNLNPYQVYAIFSLGNYYQLTDEYISERIKFVKPGMKSDEIRHVMGVT